MAKILCIETSTTNCSVAIAENGKLLALAEDDSNSYSHAEQLHVFIQQLFDAANLSASDLHAVAVSKGPGSYTGLRIGVSTAKGLCFALGIPLISVPTLEVLARQVVQDDSSFPVIAMIDARRMEVYSSVFDSKYQTIQDVTAKILDENAYAELFKTHEKLYAIGNGVTKFKEITSTAENFIFIEDRNPSAKEMLTIAEQKYSNKDFEDVAYFEPYYLKDFVGGKKKT